jgi:hypothetical protein
MSESDPDRTHTPARTIWVRARESDRFLCVLFLLAEILLCVQRWASAMTAGPATTLSLLDEH